MTSSFQPSDPHSPSTTNASHVPADFEASLTALWVFPVKSCAGISVPQAVLTPTGLAHDRAWMVVDADGEMVTQRDMPRMALIQPAWVWAGDEVSELVLQARGMSALHVSSSLPVGQTVVQVRVWDDAVPAFDMGAAASAWLTEFLGRGLGTLRLMRFDTRHARLSSVKWTQGVQALNQFSDGFAVLVASTASLDELNARLQAKGEAEVDMRRFRANVVLGHADAPHGVGLMAHDEDRIGMLHIHTEGDVVQLKPVKPCPRCPIPNIDPDTGQSHSAVSDTLQFYRQDARVNGASTFGMNCIPWVGVGQVLRVGQRVSADWDF